MHNLSYSMKEQKYIYCFTVYDLICLEKNPYLFFTNTSGMDIIRKDRV